MQNEGLAKRLINTYRDICKTCKRKTLKNVNPTIITNNCVGGILMHDMHIKFNSPTVNLFFTQDDYVKFISNLVYYTSCEVEDATEEHGTYPIGKMNRGEEEVLVHFLHYDTFENAHKKWKERCSRIDFTNIYIIMEVAEDLRTSTVEAMKNISYENKVLLTYKDVPECDFALTLDIYGEHYENGKILHFKNKLGFHRYLDDFDYISFLNDGKISLTS